MVERRIDWVARALDPRGLLVPLLGCALLAFAAQDEKKGETPPAPAKAQAPAVASVGAPAPVFRLNNQDGVAVASKGRGAWTVVAFYPKAMTPG